MSHPRLRSIRCALLLMLAVLPAWAVPPRPDAEHARDAVQRGDYVRLETLVADALRRHPGRVVEVDLDEEDDEYELEVLRDDGRVVELEYDARTGVLLDEEFDD